VSVLIAPSILSADFAALGAAIAAAERGGADLIHVDVMDGHFVPNLTYGIPFVAALKKRATIPLDVHIMVSNPDAVALDYVKALLLAGREADARRAFEAEREAVQQLSDAELSAVANLNTVNRQIDQFSTVDWNAWNERDPVAAQGEEGPLLVGPEPAVLAVARQRLAAERVLGHMKQRGFQ